MAPTKTTADPDQDQGQADGTKTKTTDDGKNPTMADVRREIREEVDAALKPVKDMIAGLKPGSDPAPKDGDSGGQAPAGNDLDGMINAALDKVLGARTAKEKEQTNEQRLAKLEAAAETKPVDRPRRSRWLGDIFDR
jgi:hypothetical protein